MIESGAHLALTATHADTTYMSLPLLRRPLLGALAALTLLAVHPIGAQQLGPVDGADLSPTDTGRVRAGMLAPDFILESFTSERIKLSDYRGKKTILLAFYRGHW